MLIVIQFLSFISHLIFRPRYAKSSFFICSLNFRNCSIMFIAQYLKTEFSSFYTYFKFYFLIQKYFLKLQFLVFVQFSFGFQLQEIINFNHKFYLPQLLSVFITCLRFYYFFLHFIFIFKIILFHLPFPVSPLQSLIADMIFILFIILS